MPIIRTFVPVIVGVAGMNRAKFFLYNVIGAVLWGFGVTFLGFLLGYIPPVARFVEHYIDIILLAAVVLSLGPTLFHVMSNRRKARRSAEADRATSD